MKAMVTGATGFLGGHLCRALLDRGGKVLALGRNPIAAEAITKLGASFLPLDLSQADALSKAATGVDCIFHCAALSSPWGRYKEFYETNVTGTRNLLRAAGAAGVRRFVHVSSPSIYFDFRDRLEISEDDKLPKRQVNAYAQTKLLAEREVDKAFASGLPVITIRPRAIFGPRDTAIIPRLLRANRERFIPTLRGGGALCDMTHVANVVHAMLLCADTSDRNLGDKYNITNGEPVVLQKFLRELFSELGEPYNGKRLPLGATLAAATLSEILHRYLFFGREPALTRYSIGVLAYNQTLDISKANERLGYEPVVSLEDGKYEVIRWLEKNR
jgi:nucleoside-diphosphate-sugar epimerase